MNYLNIEGANDSATIGIQNDSADSYLLINFNSSIESNYSLEIIHRP